MLEFSHVFYLLLFFLYAGADPPLYILQIAAAVHIFFTLPALLLTITLFLFFSIFVLYGVGAAEGGKTHQAPKKTRRRGAIYLGEDLFYYAFGQKRFGKFKEQILMMEYQHGSSNYASWLPMHQVETRPFFSLALDMEPTYVL